MKKDEYYELIEELFENGHKLNWKNLSNTCDMWFIEKHNHDYHFNFFEISQNHW